MCAVTQRDKRPWMQMRRGSGHEEGPRWALASWRRLAFPCGRQWEPASEAHRRDPCVQGTGVWSQLAVGGGWALKNYVFNGVTKTFSCNFMPTAPTSRLGVVLANDKTTKLSFQKVEWKVLTYTPACWKDPVYPWAVLACLDSTGTQMTGIMGRSNQKSNSVSGRRSPSLSSVTAEPACFLWDRLGPPPRTWRFNSAATQLASFDFTEFSLGLAALPTRPNSLSGIALQLNGQLWFFSRWS